MIKKLLPVAIVVSFGAAGLLHYLSNNGDPYANLAGRMEDYVREASAEIRTAMEDFSGEPTDLPSQNPGVHWLLYRNDTLIYYSDDHFPMSAVLDSTPLQSEKGQLLLTDNGALLTFSTSSTIKGQAFRLMALLTLYQRFLPTDSHLTTLFPSLIPTTRITPYPVRDEAGQVRFYLEKGPTRAATPPDIAVVGLSLTGFVLTFWWIHLFSFPHIGLFLGAILAVRYAMEVLLFPQLAQVPMLSTDPDTQLLAGSLGRPLTDSLLSLWLMLVFHRHFQAKSPAQGRLLYRLLLAALQVLAVGTALVLTSRLLQSLVTDPQLNIDLGNIYAIGLPGLIAVMSVLLLLTGLFLFAHRLLLTITVLSLPLREKIIALSLGLAGAAPLIFYFFQGTEAWSVLALALLYLILFDLFTSSKNPGLSWMVIWITFFSAFTAFLLYRFQLQQDLRQWQQYTRILAAPEDPLAEQGLQGLGDKLVQDSTALDYFNTPIPFDIAEASIRATIDPYFAEDLYLSRHYTYEIHLINEPFSVSLIRNQSAAPALALSSAMADIRVSAGHPEVFLPTTGQNLPPFVWKKVFPTPGNPDSRNEVYLSLRPQINTPDRIYEALLPQVSYKGIPDLNKFDYAIYKGQYPVLQKGSIPPHGLAAAIQLPPETSRVLASNNYKYLLYKGLNNNISIIGKAYGGGNKWLSLFSFLFMCFLTGIFLILLTHRFLHLIPDDFYPTGFLQPSLRIRIQASILLLILASFVIIAFVTLTFFRNSSRAYSQNASQTKTSEILAALNTEAKRGVLSEDALGWNRSLSALADIHQVDITLFTPNGLRVASSLEHLFQKGIKAPLLHPQALARLHQGASQVQLTRHIGQLQYQSSFAPLYIPSMGLHYLEIITYRPDNEQGSDRYTLIGTLVSTYVFLLLAAGALGIFVTNSITRPLSRIAEKLKGLQLGKANEPIDWTSKDELGDLIHQYNHMIGQLEENTRKLRQSEREGAWREMARQVAHEIKNPLTPMKLSIQHLLRVQEAQPERVAPLLQRTAHTLIEQIDSLSRIASEFSNFAQMPKADNKPVNLNELLQKAFDLFEKNQPGNLDLYLSLPEKTCTVFGDKEHLVRVLNNLITNAIQAIPDTRRGEVSILMDIRSNQQHILIEIRDNGSGISEAAQEKVFSPYFTTKNSGTGLGLALTKNMIEAMGGEIYFRTVPDQGTSFFIVLPLMQPEPIKDNEE